MTSNGKVFASCPYCGCRLALPPVSDLPSDTKAHPRLRKHVQNAHGVRIPAGAPADSFQWPLLYPPAVRSSSPDAPIQFLPASPVIDLRIPRTVATEAFRIAVDGSARTNNLSAGICLLYPTEVRCLGYHWPNSPKVLSPYQATVAELLAIASAVDRFDRDGAGPVEILTDLSNPRVKLLDDRMLPGITASDRRAFRTAALTPTPLVTLRRNSTVALYLADRAAGVSRYMLKPATNILRREILTYFTPPLGLRLPRRYQTLAHFLVRVAVAKDTDPAAPICLLYEHIASRPRARTITMSLARALTDLLDLAPSDVPLCRWLAVQPLRDAEFLLTSLIPRVLGNQEVRLDPDAVAVASA